MAMWKMNDETKAGFDELAERYGIRKERFADIVLKIVKERLEENPKIEIDVESLAELPVEEIQSVE